VPVIAGSEFQVAVVEEEVLKIEIWFSSRTFTEVSEGVTCDRFGNVYCGVTNEHP
jgi:hypothetical protein